MPSRWTREREIERERKSDEGSKTPAWTNDKCQAINFITNWIWWTAHVLMHIFMVSCRWRRWMWALFHSVFRYAVLSLVRSVCVQTLPCCCFFLLPRMHAIHLLSSLHICRFASMFPVCRFAYFGRFWALTAVDVYLNMHWIGVCWCIFTSLPMFICLKMCLSVIRSHARTNNEKLSFFVNSIMCRLLFLFFAGICFEFDLNSFVSVFTFACFGFFFLSFILMLVWVLISHSEILTSVYFWIGYCYECMYALCLLCLCKDVTVHKFDKLKNIKDGMAWHGISYISHRSHFTYLFFPEFAENVQSHLNQRNHMP